MSALTGCVTFTGVLAMIGLVAITTQALPQAIAAAAAADAGRVESEGSSVISLLGHDGRIVDGDATASSLRDRP